MSQPPKNLVLKILGASTWVSLGILLGRFAGLVRESTIAATFGISPTADAAVLLLTIPDFLVNILAGGALSAALIPELKRVEKSEQAPLFFQAMVTIGLLFGVLAAVLALIPMQVLYVFAPGMSGVERELASQSAAIVFWLIPLTTMAGVTMSYLQSREIFAIPAMGALIFNLSVIVGLMFFIHDKSDFVLLALFMILGGLLRWGSQLAQITMITAKTGVLGIRGALHGRRISRSLVSRYLQAASSGGILLLFPVIARATASLQGEGGLAIMNYAMKMVEFPQSVGVSVLAVVLFPKLSESFAARDEGGYATILREGSQWVILLGLCALVPMIWFRNDFAELAFGWGRMDAVGLGTIGDVMAIGLVGLPLQGLTILLSLSFNARGDTLTPLWINILGVVAFGLTSLLLGERHGLYGVAAALVVSYLLVLTLQVTMLRVRHGVSLIGVVLGGRTIRFVVTALALGSAAGWAGADAPIGLAGRLVMALVTGGTILILSILTTRQYRDYLMSIFHKWGRHELP